MSDSDAPRFVDKRAAARMDDDNGDARRARGRRAVAPEEAPADDLEEQLEAAQAAA